MIATERLIVRAFKAHDYMDLYEYLSDPAIYAFEPGKPINVDEAKALVAQREKSNDFFAVVLKENEKMIGHLYFNQIGPKEVMTWELGYIFNPRFSFLKALFSFLKFSISILDEATLSSFCGGNSRDFVEYS